MIAADLRTIAEEKLRDALLLLENHRWSNAYYLAGYAIEVALKVILAGRFRAGEIPDRRFVNSIYTHDLESLVDLAQLKAALAERKQVEAFAANWAVVANWSEESRYELVEESDAQAICAAVGDPDFGVFPWLKRHW